MRKSRSAGGGEPKAATAELLTPVDTVRLPEIVAERVLEYITAKNLKIGDTLPSHRELACRLGVSRPVLRAGLHRLEAQGIIEVRHGSGTRVARAVLPEQLHSPLDEFSHSSALAILEARMIIDVELAAFAAERADETDIQRLVAALERIRVIADSGNPTVRATSMFHQLIALAARNPVLLEFYERMRLPMLANGRRIEFTLPETTSGEYENHRELFDALLTRDPETAREAMRRHLRKAHMWEETVARLRGELLMPLSGKGDET